MREFHFRESSTPVRVVREKYSKIRVSMEHGVWCRKPDGYSSSQRTKNCRSPGYLGGMIECPHCHQTFELDEAIDLKLRAHLKQELELQMKAAASVQIEEAVRKASAETEEKTKASFALELARLEAARQEREKTAVELIQQAEKMKADQERERLAFAQQLEMARRQSAAEEANRLEALFAEKVQELSIRSEAQQQKLNEFTLREAELELKRQSIEAEINKKLQEKLTSERALFEKQREDDREAMRLKLAGELSVQMEILKKENEEKEAKVKAFREREVALEAEKRALQSANEEAEHRRRLAFEEEKSRSERQLKEKLELEFNNRLLEKESQIEAMRKNAESMQKQARQGLARNQGEAQEEYLKRRLQEQFPGDRVEDIKTGKLGADLKLYVYSENRLPSGLVLIESKNAENFSNAWVEKLKQDCARESADIAVLVSTALPDKMEHFGQREGVWICAPGELVPMMEVLRVALIDIYRMRASLQGMETKAGRLYEYLTSTEFTQRVGTVLDTFRSLKEQLEKERIVFEKQWAEREKLLNTGSRALANVFGHVGGIAGRDLPEVETFKLEG